MAKRQLHTPNNIINSALRKLWLRSRERAATLKRDNYTCQRCGGKQSRAKGKEFKVEVHHKHGVLNWGKLHRVIREYLLCDPKYLETLCRECHKAAEREE